MFFFKGDDNEDINFEESPPPPPPSPTDSGNSDSSGDSGTNQPSPGYEKDPGDTNLPSAVSYQSSFFPITKNSISIFSCLENQIVHPIPIWLSLLV